MDKVTKLALHFTIPLELSIPEGTVPDDALKKQLVETAKKMLLRGSYDPRIEIVYDAVSEDKVEQDQVPGVQDGQSEVHNDVGTPERKNTDSNESLQGNEPGAVERNDAGSTGYSRDGSKDRKEEERGVHVDQTV